MHIWQQPSHVDRLERARRLDLAAVRRLWADGVVIGVGREPSVLVTPATAGPDPWLIDGLDALHAARQAFTGSVRLVTRPTAGTDYEPQRHLLLGLVDGRAWFIDRFDRPVGLELRRALPLLDPLQAGIAMAATALVAWHDAAGFCPACGGVTTVTAAGVSRRCGDCGRDLFPRTDPAIIVAVIDDHDRLLLARQSTWEPGRFSVLAGFLEAGESVEQAVHREIAEEVGLAVDRVEYVSSQPWPFPRSLMLGFRAHAGDTRLRLDGDEIAEARWFDREECRQAVAAGRLLLPGPASIAFRLITGWLERR